MKVVKNDNVKESRSRNAGVAHRHWEIYWKIFITRKSLAILRERRESMQGRTIVPGPWQPTQTPQPLHVNHIGHLIGRIRITSVLSRFAEKNLYFWDTQASSICLIAPYTCEVHIPLACKSLYSATWSSFGGPPWSVGILTHFPPHNDLIIDICRSSIADQIDTRPIGASELIAAQLYEWSTPPQMSKLPYKNDIYSVCRSL